MFSIAHGVRHPLSYHVTLSIFFMVRITHSHSGVLRQRLKPLLVSTTRRACSSSRPAMKIVLSLSKVICQVASGVAGKFLMFFVSFIVLVLNHKSWKKSTLFFYFLKILFSILKCRPVLNSFTSSQPLTGRVGLRSRITRQRHWGLCLCFSISPVSNVMRVLNHRSPQK